jgi:hypothetical protein
VSRLGQVLIEHLMVLGLILAPLFTLGLQWGFLESEKARCALRAFLDARTRLILENREVAVKLECANGIREQIRLKALDSIAVQDPPVPEQEIKRALSLWAPLWSSSPSSQGPDSGTNSFTSAPSSSDRSPSTAVPDERDSISGISSGLLKTPAGVTTPD